MSEPFGAHNHTAHVLQSTRNDDGEHADNMIGIETDDEGENADNMTEHGSDDNSEHDDEMTEVGSNTEEEDYPPYDTRNTGPTLVSPGHGGSPPSTSTGNPEHALLQHSAIPRRAQYSGIAPPQNDATALTAPQHQEASPINHATNILSQSWFDLGSRSPGSLRSGPGSSAAYQPASPYVESNTSAPRLYAEWAQPSGFGVDGAIEHQSTTNPSPTVSSDEDMEDEQDEGEYDEQSEEEDGEEHESEGEPNEDEDVDDESDDGMSDFSAMSIAEPPQPIRPIISLLDLDTVLQAATEKLHDFIRIPHNILRNRTEPSLYDLADELWSEADYPDQEAGSVQYFETEGDAAESAGVKIGVWTGEAAKGYVSATQLLDRLAREQRSAQALRPVMENDGELSRAQLVAVFRELNTTNTLLQFSLRKLDDARNSMRRLTRTMHGHKEFRHVVPRTPDAQIHISIVTAEVETYEPFKLERFLLRCQRLGREDVDQGERCMLCCEEISLGHQKEKSKLGTDRSEGVEEVEKEEEPTEAVRLRSISKQKGRVVDVACLRSWLQTSSKCPLTNKKLY